VALIRNLWSRSHPQVEEILAEKTAASLAGMWHIDRSQ
jgi:hypothetical protein